MWAGLISLLSTDPFSGGGTGALLGPILRALLPGAQAETIEAIHGAVRKLAHVVEYAILGALVVRALDLPRRSLESISVRALLLCGLFAGLDEFHQSFVPSRTGALSDVLLDTFGAALGVIGAAVVRRRDRPGSPRPPVAGEPDRRGPPPTGL